MRITINSVLMFILAIFTVKGIQFIQAQSELYKLEAHNRNLEIKATKLRIELLKKNMKKNNIPTHDVHYKREQLLINRQTIKF